MQREHKGFPATLLKAGGLEGEGAGIIEAIVSVFGNIDAAGEVVEQGFFTESLAKKLPPGIWMHDWSQPVAKTLEARELAPGDPLLPEAIRGNGGLYVKGQFNLGTQRGRDAFSDIAAGIVDEFSFGYSVQESEWDKAAACRRLRKGTIYEWSPVLVGCNPATALISAKTAPGAATKGVLSEYLPGQMGLAALREAQSAMYWVLYDIVTGWGTYEALSVEERVVLIKLALDEFCAIAGNALAALLRSGAAQDSEEMTKALADLAPEPHPRLQKAAAAEAAAQELTQSQLEAARLLVAGLL